MTLHRILLAALCGFGLPVAAQAQALSCTIPADLPAPRPDGPSAKEPRRLMPVARYTLALSWSPYYCYGKAGSAKDGFQCGGASRFGFVLHGLWPDGAGATWPQYCRPARILPERVIRETLCSTPSVQLVQHEWAKHGTCERLSPRAFFARSRSLYKALRFPDMATLARRDDLTAGGLASAFAAANRSIRADMVRVNISRSGWLDELWLCLDRRLRYATCPAGAGGAPRATKLRITEPG